MVLNLVLISLIIYHTSYLRPSDFYLLFSYIQPQLAFVPKRYAQRNKESFHCIKCVKKDGQFDPSSIGPPPYYSYMDSASRQFEFASGARASIPGKEHWPEGTVRCARAARAPEPVCKSEGKPSYGRNPGSRRKKYKGQGAVSDIAETCEDYSDQIVLDNSDDILEEPKDPSEESVIYKAEAEEENLTSYALDKRLGRPHPFIDPAVVKPIDEPRSSEELWWNWQKTEKEQWSRWQRRRPNVNTVSAKAMAETGHIKLYGDHPTITETALAI